MRRRALHEEIVQRSQLSDERNQDSSSVADYDTLVIAAENAGSSGIPDQIPLEIVSEEEMARIDAAMMSARGLIRASSSLGSRSFGANSLPSAFSPLRQCSSSSCSVSSSILAQNAPSRDIEDFEPRQSQIKPSPLKQFRVRRALSVTDITATEWCEKQMEFVLLRGKPQMTKAMKAGSDRHVELEEEVTTKVEIRIKTVEDSWAVRLLNFSFGTQQLLFDGLTRELPIIGMVEGIWMTGVIDEIRIPSDEIIQSPMLVDTKTRYKPTLPSDAQKRNGRLQLMCYKYLWDNTVARDFPRNEFYRHFELDPRATLSVDVVDCSSRLGLRAKTLDDIVGCFDHHCQLLPPSHDKLLLRYEFQGNQSLLEEYMFDYDGDWFKSQLMGSFAFWLGEKEASFVSKEEEWKCRFCSFRLDCPVSQTRS